jgi:hypothetical protein
MTSSSGGDNFKTSREFVTMQESEGKERNEVKKKDTEHQGSSENQPFSRNNCSESEGGGKVESSSASKEFLEMVVGEQLSRLSNQKFLSLSLSFTKDKRGVLLRSNCPYIKSGAVIPPTLMPIVSNDRIVVVDKTDKILCSHCCFLQL